MKNPPGLDVIHMLESDGVKRRALRARRLERPPIKLDFKWRNRAGGAKILQFVYQKWRFLGRKLNDFI